MTFSRYSLKKKGFQELSDGYFSIPRNFSHFYKSFYLSFSTNLLRAPFLVGILIVYSLVKNSPFTNYIAKAVKFHKSTYKNGVRVTIFTFRIFFFLSFFFLLFFFVKYSITKICNCLAKKKITSTIYLGGVENGRYSRYLRQFQCVLLSSPSMWNVRINSFYSKMRPGIR